MQTVVRQTEAERLSDLDVRHVLHGLTHLNAAAEITKPCFSSSFSGITAAYLHMSHRLPMASRVGHGES